MADVAISLQNWRVLRRSANCFIPRLMAASAAPAGGFSNSALYRAGLTRGLVTDFSLHIIGNVMALRAVTHTKAEQFLEAYKGLPADLQSRHGPMDQSDIVGAFFVILKLRDLLQAGGLTETELAALSRVSPGCVWHALGGGRVTAGIAGALHTGLTTRIKKPPSLQEFATSGVSSAIGGTAVKNTPFDLNDLLLPAPANAPDPWP